MSKICYVGLFSTYHFMICEMLLLALTFLPLYSPETVCSNYYQTKAKKKTLITTSMSNQLPLEKTHLVG